MEAFDFLLTLAEISIAFVGFSAIVLIFRQLASGKFSAFQHLQVSFLIAGGLVALFLCVLPPLVTLFPLGAVTSWRLASAVQALALGAMVAVYALRRRGSIDPSEAPRVSRTGYLLRTGGTSSVAVLQLLNALVPAESLVVPIYCAGVVWLLGILAWLFFAFWRAWGGPTTRS